MFQQLAVGKIVEVAEVFGLMFSRELNKVRAGDKIRQELLVMFDNALVATAKKLDTTTAKVSVDTIRPQLKHWLGVK